MLEYVWFAKGKKLNQSANIPFQKFYFVILRYSALFKVVSNLWVCDWQTVQDIWCYFVFTPLLRSQETLATVDVIFN